MHIGNPHPHASYTLALRAAGVSDALDIFPRCTSDSQDHTCSHTRYSTCFCPSLRFNVASSLPPTLRDAAHFASMIL